MKAKNHLLSFDLALLAYFRFQDLTDMFSQDSYREINAEYVGYVTNTSVVGYDIIPNDICPSNINQRKFAIFNEDT